MSVFDLTIFRNVGENWYKTLLKEKLDASESIGAEIRTVYLGTKQLF